MAQGAYGVMPKNPKFPILCAVCRGHANSPHGYGFRGRPQIGACADATCITLLPKVYDMPKEALEAYEKKAAAVAGEKAGAYLDEIERYDLGQLSGPQWEHFCQTMVIGFQDEMRRMIEANEAPF
jgi:hypothetical protein